MVDGRRAQPFDGRSGHSGIEFQTAVGRIDLLARDDHDGLIVFEFKRAKAPDRAIGQLTRYMGCIQDTIADGRKVTGVMVAAEIGDELRYCVRSFPTYFYTSLNCSLHLTR